MSQKKYTKRMKDKYSLSDSDVEIENEHDRHGKLWQRKLQLIKEIDGCVEKRKEPLNILIVGSPGCGKSSFLNTVMTSFREDHWKSYATVGKHNGETSNITHHFKSYRASNTYYQEKPLTKLPTIIDLNGLEDERENFGRIFLKALCDGKIREQERLTYLRDVFNSDPDGFAKKMKSRWTYLKVDRIIVVASSDPVEMIPVDLYKCIRETSLAAGGIPVFGIMTKKDQFKDSEGLAKKIESFLCNLGITEDSFKMISNYCPDVDNFLTYHDKVNPSIDVPVLFFMRQVVNRDFKHAMDMELSAEDKVTLLMCLMSVVFATVFLPLGLFIMITFLAYMAGRGQIDGVVNLPLKLWNILMSLN